jgi:hypothetical protein
MVVEAIRASAASRWSQARGGASACRQVAPAPGRRPETPIAATSTSTLRRKVISSGSRLPESHFASA